MALVLSFVGIVARLSAAFHFIPAIDEVFQVILGPFHLAKQFRIWLVLLIAKIFQNQLSGLFRVLKVCFFLLQ